MKMLHDMPVWAPTPDELRAIDKKVRAERAKAFRSAVTFISRKVGNAFINERAADKVHLNHA